MCFPARVSRDNIRVMAEPDSSLACPVMDSGRQNGSGFSHGPSGQPSACTPQPGACSEAMSHTQFAARNYGACSGQCGTGWVRMRRALRALRRRRTLRCRCRHRPLRPRALIPFPWREACPAWWGRDIKPRLPWPSAIFRHIITRRASPIAETNTARSMAFMRWLQYAHTHPA